MDENDDDSVIPSLTRSEYEAYVKKEIIKGGGMLPKLENAFKVIEGGAEGLYHQRPALSDPESGTVLQ